MNAEENRFIRRQRKNHRARYGMRVDRAAQRKARFIARRLEKIQAEQTRQNPGPS